jgi:flagellar basal-body rod modification protein FlgD
MTVSSVSSATSANTLSSSAQTIAGNYDTFLNMLTTQLQNQDPLSPMDTNQFTSQLVQFSSVEQQLQTNTYLQSMMQASQDSSNSGVVSYIGKTVTSSGVSSDLSNGQATWNFNLPSAATVSVSIKDSTGSTVYSETGSMPQGSGAFNWNGKTSSGGVAPDGTYTISIDAQDSSGGFVAATTETNGVVTGVDLSGSTPKLLVGNTSLLLGNITSVRATDTTPTTPTTPAT